MSSMRNAVHRRNHRERAQPQERSKWGILEKHKDYSLRARDYNAKKAHLKSLQQKAADRNPDEFYFGMMSTKVDKDGHKIGDRGNKALSVDAVRLLKTQDAGYLRVVAQKARKEVEALQRTFLVGRGEEAGGVHVVGSQEVDGQKARSRTDGRHVVFVESREEQLEFLPPGRGRLEAKDGDETEGGTKHDRRTLEKSSARLKACQARQRQIEAAARALELQRAKMAKTPSVGGINKWGVKWKARARRR